MAKTTKSSKAEVMSNIMNNLAEKYSKPVSHAWLYIESQNIAIDFALYLQSKTIGFEILSKEELEKEYELFIQSLK